MSEEFAETSAQGVAAGETAQDPRNSNGADMPKMPIKLDARPVEFEVMRSVMPPQHQAAFDMLRMLYGNDVNELINGLMDMTVRAAILGGVEADMFGAGMKHHWDMYANEINKLQN